MPLAAAGLLLLCLATASLVPLFDPDEGYYPATALETLASGVAWDLRLNNQPRWDKPILSYGLIEASFAIFGPTVAAARLPSALEGAALVLVIGIVTTRLTTRRAGGLAATVAATTLFVQVFSRAAHPEIAVVLSILTTELLLCVWLVRPPEEHGAALPIAIGASVAYGVLAKGPVAVALPALMLVVAVPVLRVRRPAGRVARDVALAAATAVVLAVPWYAVMTVRYGPTFLYQAVWHQNVTRYATNAYRHAASTFFFLLPVAIGLLPWTGLLPGSLRGIFRREASGRQVLRTCMGASALTAFAFYSLSASKLANYALVIVPPLAVLIALHLDEAIDRSEPGPPASARGVGAVLSTLGAALLVLPLLVGRVIAARELLGGVPIADADVAARLWPLAVPAGGVLIVAGALVATAAPRIRLATLVAAGALVPLLVLTTAAPMLRAIYPWAAFGTEMRGDADPVWLYGYRAPSLAFYARRPIVGLREPEALESAVAASPAGGWLLMDAETWSATSQQDEWRRRDARVVRTGGRMVLVRVSPPAPRAASCPRR